MSSICRLCLNKLEADDESVVDNSCPEVKIKFLMPEIKIDITPTFKLCTNCVHSLNSAYSFKHMCLEIDELISKYTKNTDVVDLQYVRDQTFFESEHVNTDDSIKSDSIEDTLLVENTEPEGVEDDVCLSVNYNSYDDDEKSMIDELISKNSKNTELVDLQYVRDQKFFESEYVNTDDSIKSDNRDSIEDTLLVENTELEDVKDDVCLSVNYNSYDDDECQKNYEKSMIFKCEQYDEVLCQDLPETHHQSSKTSYEYNCVICNITFKSYDSLKQHTDRHVKIVKKYICDICDKGYCKRTDFNAHKEFHSGKKWYCEVCGKGYLSSRYLKNHMRNSHNGKIVCNICGIKCAHNHQLTDHLRTHTGERPYKCEYCGMGFAQSGTLNNHMRCIHSTEKPFVCETCGKAFSMKYYLRRHIATHLDVEETFTCTVCNKGLGTKKSLRNHMLRHTKPKNHKCPVCVKEFFDTTSLKLHLRVHTGDRPYECYTCQKTFSKKYNLQVHFRSHRKKREVK